MTFVLLCIILILLIIYFVLTNIISYNEYDYEIICESKFNEYNNSLKKFEQKLSNYYHYADDYFRIDHGDQYMNFFKRLGKCKIHICSDKNQIIGNAISILRNIKNIGKCLYLCDLKVDMKHRNKYIPFKLINNGLNELEKTDKFYMIAMTGKACDKLERFIYFMNSFSDYNITYAGLLYIYTITFDQLKYVDKDLEKIDKYFFVSSANKKDLILKSTNKPMEILHINFNKYKFNATYDNFYLEPLKDHMYMFCLHENNKLVKVLKNKRITTDVTAKIFHNNMKSDFGFIQTSDI